jgi:hypothetical protein
MMKPTWLEKLRVLILLLMSFFVFNANIVSAQTVVTQNYDQSDVALQAIYDQVYSLDDITPAAEPNQFRFSLAAPVTTSPMFSVDTNTVIGKVPSRPMGFSNELGDTQVVKSANGLQLMKNLTPYSYRVGGSSGNIACLKKFYSGPHCKILWDQARTDTIVAAAKGQNAAILSFNLNFLRGAEDINAIIEQAKMVDATAKAAGLSVVYEVGNEADLFVPQNTRPNDLKLWAFDDFQGQTTPSLQTYTSEYKVMAARLRKEIPGIKFHGPDLCCRTKSTNKSLFEFGKLDVQALTWHPYDGAHCDKTKPGSDTAFLFDQKRMVRLKTGLAGLAKAYPTKQLVLNETNSVACGGSIGVSNSAAMIAWLVDRSFILTLSGVTSQNIHTAGVIYAPLYYDKAASKTLVNPIYYGMLMFNQFRNLSLVNTTRTDNGTENVQVWSGIDQNSGVMRVVVLNKDLTKPESTISIQIPGKSSRANNCPIIAASHTSTKVDRWGDNAVIDPVTGKTSLHCSATVSPNADSTYTVTVPSGLATMLIIK